MDENDGPEEAEQQDGRGMVLEQPHEQNFPSTSTVHLSCFPLMMHERERDIPFLNHCILASLCFTTIASTLTNVVLLRPFYKQDT